MKEIFLQQVWLNHWFEIRNLKTTTGSSIQILKSGILNQNQGPDFLNATLLIDGITLHGSIEVHIKASDWYEHKHNIDKKYNSTILHVVNTVDTEVVTEDGYTVPTLHIAPYIYEEAIHNYQRLCENVSPIPCASFIHNIEQIYKTWAIDHAFLRRVYRKGKEIAIQYQPQDLDWNQLAYHALLKAFGQHLNKHVFEKLAKTVPYKLIQKHQANQTEIETLLLGTCQLLNKDSEADKRKEFEYLANKYNIQLLDEAELNHAKIRPSSAPAQRLKQVAYILARSNNIFEQIIEMDTDWLRQVWGIDINNTLNIKKSNNNLSTDAASLLFGNTLVYLLGVHSNVKTDYDALEKLIDIADKLKPDNNNIILKLKKLNFKLDTFFQTQGAIELYNEYCTKHQCLHCHIGKQIIYPKS